MYDELKINTQPICHHMESPKPMGATAGGRDPSTGEDLEAPSCPQRRRCWGTRCEGGVQRPVGVMNDGGNDGVNNGQRMVYWW